MCTINELFYASELERSHIYQNANMKLVEFVVKLMEENHHAKDQKKGNEGEVSLKVDLICEACDRKVPRVLIQPTVNCTNVNVPTRKVTITDDLKPSVPCLKALTKIRKRASLWADIDAEAEAGGGNARKNINRSDGNG